MPDVSVYVTNDEVIEMSQHWPCSQGDEGTAAVLSGRRALRARSTGKKRSWRLLVVGVFSVRVVGHIPYGSDFRNTLPEGGLNALFKGQTDCRATLAAATKTQHRH